MTDQSGSDATAAPSGPPAEGEIVVCLAMPGVQRDDQIERVRAMSDRIRVEVLPIDADGSQALFDSNPGIPHEEPPPWAGSVADERRRILSETNVLLALYIPSDLGDLAPRLTWIQGIGAGVEQFAKTGVRASRTLLTNASGTSSTSMAEFVIGRILQVWKHFREIDENQRQHRFVRTYGRTFKGTTVGIVGFGYIGRAVARCVNALGGRSLGMRRSAPSEEDLALTETFYTPDQLHELLGASDVVVVAAPATPSTDRLIGEPALEAMRDGSVLVNVARGSLVDEPAVIGALESGKLSAAILDVFDNEPLAEDDPIWDAPNAYLSGHSSVSVDRYMDDVFDLFEENLRLWLDGKPMRNVVDMKALGFPE